MHAGTACSHCMREGDSGFRFQNAERQRHAAVVTQGETGPQAVRGHPPCAAARKAVFRSAAFQPDGLDLAEGERPCKAGARRLEEGFLRGKSAAALADLWALSGSGMLPVRPRASRSDGPKTLAAKAGPWAPPRLFAIRAVLQRSQPMP